MKNHLPFLEHGPALLDAMARERLLCAFDFDGTLAPIVTQPERARMPLPVLQRVRELQHHLPVAIITGRSIGDIRGKLGFTPDFLIGNHGQEGAPGTEDHATRHEAMCREWKRQLERLLAVPGTDPGIRIEDKTWSLTLHYRLARDQPAAAAQLQAMLSKLTPTPRLVGGKCVFNVVPQDALDKGGALLALMRACEADCAFYVGDDVTDEDVFRLMRPDILGVRIGHRSDSAARFYLNHRVELLQVLEHLVRSARACGARNWVQAHPDAPAA